ncbi:uncharacterized protein LOC34624194 [Cyclospora cayetanensis]|uniref:Uncharacterized protein LOC34624194 n=1 Tax=Cyclospora cayetanensis TaxID=88456 RepID=A0A6P6RV30_9EIME|nr:uncharacterized protein LOC34624194 [Cyclospora cayetanensis]
MDSFWVRVRLLDFVTTSAHEPAPYGQTDAPYWTCAGPLMPRNSCQYAGPSRQGHFPRRRKLRAPRVGGPLASRFPLTNGSGRSQAEGSDGETPGVTEPSESAALRGVDSPEHEAPLPSVEDVCGGSEDLSACDFVRDGICVISAGYMRLWHRRRRWRESAPRRGPPEPRWVEGLRIRSQGDIEVRGAVIKCTQSALRGEAIPGKRRRLRVRGPSGFAWAPNFARGATTVRGASAARPPPDQRIELCTVGSIRLLGGARLHCTETLLFTGDSVTVAETADITASGTVQLRGPSPYTSPDPDATLELEPLSTNAPLENIARRLKALLAVGRMPGEKGPLPQGNSSLPATAPISGPASLSDAAPQEGKKGETTQRVPQLEPTSEAELRGGSHGGLGGVATDRCEATAFSHPLKAPLEVRGNMLLPLSKGEAGVLHSSRVSSSKRPLQDASSGQPSQHDSALQPPRGGGLVVIVAARHLAVEGQVSSSGEPGWGCGEEHWELSESAHQSHSAVGIAESRPARRSAVRALKSLMLRLVSFSSGRVTAAGAHTSRRPVATCAAGGSGGSIVLVAESLSFASHMRSGRVTAAGGGCLGGRPGRGGKRSGSASEHSSASPQESSGAGSWECAAGGGGRIAIYAEQPHPLDPVVLAPGGCGLRSNRLDLMPCLCGGGGTIFSRAHRRLVVANKLTAIAAAAASQPNAWESNGTPAAPRPLRSTHETANQGGRNSPVLEGGEVAGTLLGIASVDGAPMGAPSGLEALAVLSVQPTPLPVPLYAPSITLAVEAAVVTFGSVSAAVEARGWHEVPKGPEASRQETSEKGGPRKEPKVVLGSLLLHGGTRGSALHVLAPLHLHAAEGSIRLRQRSALVLAPCGSNEAQPASSPLEGPCSSESLPLAGRLLGVAVVVSSVASVSVGEGAAIRIIPGPRDFLCGGETVPAIAVSQQRSLEATKASGIGLLAGERLMLHGNLVVAATPSDCLPVPVKQTTALLFGGREVSVRGEQQLDRLVLLSQGTVTLGGSCTVGAPNRCTARRTPLFRKPSNGTAVNHSTVCTAVEEYTAAQVAPQLQAAAAADGVTSPPSLLHGYQGWRLQGADSYRDAERSSSGANSAEADVADPLGVGVSDSCSGRPLADSRMAFGCLGNTLPGFAPHEASWSDRLLRAVRQISPEGGHQGKARESRRHAKEEGLSQERANSPPRGEQPHGDAAASGIASLEDGAPVGFPGKVMVVEALSPPVREVAKQRKKRGFWRGLAALLEPEAAFSPPKAPSAEGIHRSSLRSPASESEAATEGAEASASAGRDSPLKTPQRSLEGMQSDEGASESSETSAFSSLRWPSQTPFASLEQEPFPLTSRVSPAAAALGGEDAPRLNDGVAASATLADVELLQAGSVPWGHLDATIFARDGVVLEAGASLVGGALLVCGGHGNTQLQGTIDASRRGCQPVHGPGAGSRGVALDSPSTSSEAANSQNIAVESALLCGGGGGAHVGSGGDGVHAVTGFPCRGSGGVGYDRELVSKLQRILPSSKAAAAQEASVGGERLRAFASTASASGGGGDVARAGSGGGVVWVQGQVVTVEGQILADGGGGELMQDAIIDVEVDPEKCTPLAPPVGEAQRGSSESAGDSGLSALAAAAAVSTGAAAWNGVGTKVGEGSFSSGALSQSNVHDGVLLSSTRPAQKRSRSEEDDKATLGSPFTRDSVSCQLSGILSDPAQLGQGGGAGGSVVIETAILLGGGTVSAQGGSGGRCTGGGGGGGAIDFLWDIAFFTWPERLPPEPDLRLPKSHGFDVSSQLAAEAEAKAGALQGHQGGSAFIPWIRPLNFAAGFSGSLLVNGGRSDPSTACGPLQLPLGYSGSPGEVRSALGCPPGHAGWRCSPCPVGYFSLGGGDACLSCTNKPSDAAFYTREGVRDPQCPFACAEGYPDAAVNPRCLPLFRFVLDALLSFAVLLPMGAVCVILLGLAALIREMARRRSQQGWGYGALFGSPRSSIPVYVGALESGVTAAGFGGVQPSPSSSLGFLGGSTEERRMHLAVHHLTLEDLPFHVLRIYLHGRNSPDSPWGLDGQPPSFLEPLIIPHRFAGFAAAANSLCGFSRSFVCLYGALSFLYPPLAALLLRRARSRRADKLIALCSTLSGGPSGASDGGSPGALPWGRRGPPWRWFLDLLRFARGSSQRRGIGVSATASFWRSIRARELSFALKFGCDPDCTLGFVDVLDLDRNILDYRCSPQLPLVLLTQGDGRTVPFTLARGIREPGAPRSARGLRQADEKGTPADPLQGALEELASPWVWACIVDFFSEKVKELTTEELGALRALRNLETDDGRRGAKGGADYQVGGSQEVGKCMGTSLPSNPPETRTAVPNVSSPFSRCGRCGKLQLPSACASSGGGGPLGMLMGGPLYALRTVARLCEGIRLMSNRLLKPHGISAAVVFLESRGFVSRTDGVRRATGIPQEIAAFHSRVPKRSSRRPPLPNDERQRCRGLPALSSGKRGAVSGDAVPPAPWGPLGGRRLLLRAASSPSALLDSLRRNGGTQEDKDAAFEATFSGGSLGADSLTGRRDSRHDVERGGSTASFEALGSGPQQGRPSYCDQRWGEGVVTVEREAALALVITEEASESGAEVQQGAPSARERGVTWDASTQAVAVPCFPPASSTAVTSPLDPRRLSPGNPPLAPYTAAAATALQKSIPYWGAGLALPVPQTSGGSGGPPTLRQAFDRSVLPSPKQQVPGSKRGLRRVVSPFSELSSPQSHATSPVSPRERAEDGTRVTHHKEAGGPAKCLVMCLADAARRSAGADAQHLRDAVEALQKSARAKLGTVPQSSATAVHPESSAEVSRITTMSAAEPEAEGARPAVEPHETLAPQRSILRPLPLLQLAWRRLRFRSSPTEMARQVESSPLYTHAHATPR